ncbi:DUF5361 domain-containing protein [Companilactobacillus kimchii]|uniref:Phage protein n=2 Tax=Companilactobacillus kimchii TaxID=2801452 RepID=A0ABR5NWB6_9LACO|nr:DUF5361 domain-containing protein [Companilactobacillus kimchii]KAE9561287.1 hypothetical protein ATN91_07555 [Companilactobacillus kimchii]KRK53135.1 hypothetical protein FC97_GL001601 [Companilactobacillus kimchii DSM 13961 = JCM 10707]
MIKIDKDALMCDLAETYQIYDLKQLPLTKVAVFSLGLKDDSRIKMKMRNQKFDLNQILLMSVADNLKLLLWSKTKDAQKGRNKPVLWSSLFEEPKEKKEIVFNSGEDFEKERNRLLKKGGHN